MKFHEEFPDISRFYRDIAWSYINLKPNESCYFEQDNRSYVSNSFGHRGPEFVSKVDALIVGCSVTYGIGLELEETWGALVSKQLGYSYNLLAYPGGSISKMVRQIVQYIYTIGKPKKILALFPEPRRVDLFEPLPDQTDFLTMNPNEIRIKLNTMDDLMYRYPVNSENIYEIDYITLNSINSLNILESICKLLDIDLLWSSWSTRKVLDTYKTFPSFFQLKTENGDDITKNSKCHAVAGNNFYIASDNDHWGHHYHLHVAEEFVRELQARQ